MNWMMKNSDGDPDAMLTIAIVAFMAVTINIFLATFGGLTVAGVTFDFTVLAAGTITAYLTPTLGAYVTRRWTKSAYSSGDSKGKEKEEEVKEDLIKVDGE